MATIPYEIVVDHLKLKVIKWETLTTTNADGQPYPFSGWYPDKCVQLIGTVGASLTLKIQGCNLPAGDTFGNLNDVAGDPISIAAAGFIQVLESPLWIRPLVEGGDGTTDVDIYLIMRNH